MSDQNGNGHKEWLAEQRSQFESGEVDDSMMSDWIEHWPCLRSFLLGDRNPGKVLLPGRLTLTRSARVMSLTAHSDQFGYIARYSDKSVPSMYETLETDLSLSTVPWEEDYTTKRQMRSKYSLR